MYVKFDALLRLWVDCSAGLKVFAFFIAYVDTLHSML